MTFWGKKDDELPEALRGKTPEQIAAALQKAADLEATVNTLTTEKANLESQFNDTKTKLTELNTTVEELKAKVPPEKPPAEEPPSLWTDPDKYIDQRTKGIENTALLSGMMSAKLYAKQGLGQRDLKIWNKFEKEIDQTMNGFTPQQRVLPQSWLMALTLTKGNHEAEISAAERGGTDFFAESGTGHQPPPDVKAEDKLTPDEEEACKTFRWDPKRYLARKKEMQMAQSEKGGYAHFPASAR